MRLFIAICFSSKTLDAIGQHLEALGTGARSGRFTRRDNLHLTLAFLGECDQGQEAAALAVMKALSAQPLDLVIRRREKVGREGGAMWWLRVEENERLAELQQQLWEGLEAAGWEPERRPFRPHITLGRQVQSDEVPGPIQALRESVDAIVLLQSERVEGELIYRPRFVKKLGGTL